MICEQCFIKLMKSNPKVNISFIKIENLRQLNMISIAIKEISYKTIKTDLILFSLLNFFSI